MKWQKDGELTRQGEQLTTAYLNGERGGDLEDLFPGKVSSNLERRARDLINTFDLHETYEPEQLDEVNIEVVKPRILHFDIETTNFDPTYGTVLMMGYGWYGEEETYLVSVLDEDTSHLKPFDKDYYVLKEISEILNSADVLSGHFSRHGKFDISFLNTRLMYHGLPPLEDIDHVDTQALGANVRGKTRASSSLKNLAQLLLDDEAQKGGVPKRVWYNAQHGDEEALRELEDYCKQDVVAQRELLPKLLPYIRSQNIPGYQVLFDKERMSCMNIACGSEDIERVGWKRTRVMKYPRYKCNDCGKNMRGRQSVTDRNIPRLTDG